MAYTYLEILNLALREVNEVPLTASTFTLTRGLQQFAKEAVNRAYFDISNQSLKWPWLQTPMLGTAETTVRALTQGVQWYDIKFNALHLEADWNTFLLLNTDPAGVEIPTIIENLPMITYDEWIDKFRVQDYLATAEAVPRYVVKHPSGKFGISPVPDGNYWVEHNVRNAAVRFTASSDIIPFPEEFSTVLIAKIKYYLWLFRENQEQASFSKGEYDEGLATMKRILLSNKSETMRMG